MTSVADLIPLASSMALTGTAEQVSEKIAGLTSLGVTELAQATDQSGSRFTQFMIEVSYLRDIANSSSSNHPALRTLGQTVRLLLKGCQFEVFRCPLA
jgi:hypothetical protein